MSSNDGVDNLFFQGLCCDNYCKSVISFILTESLIICPKCGRKQEKSALQNVKEVSTEYNFHKNNCVKRLFFSNKTRVSEMVKVHGLSNFHCKMLSPLLTRYGMDKLTGKAKLLTEMNQGEIFDCSLFGDRAFLIEPNNISVSGYGRDDTGSMNYLAETLNLIKAANDGEERLIPIYTDGDGHCLVHAISRALVGRELFWHPLRSCLKRHFQANLVEYKELFKEFVDSDEWDSIINECDPDFKPPEGEFHGLRNIHIFGFANILRRPIILLDSYECMRKSADYSAVFLPCLSCLPDECRGKDGSLNKPICIAWSSFSHNHYIPLVGIKDRPLPVLPYALVPTVWGLPQNQIHQYIEFENGKCTIGGGRPLSDAYIHRLVSAMEVLFYEKNGVQPSLVYDVKHDLCQNVFPNADLSALITRTRLAAEEGRLYRCNFCEALCEWQIPQDWLRCGGHVYKKAFCTHHSLIPNNSYRLDICVNQPPNSIVNLSFKYDAIANRLIPEMNSSRLRQCPQCTSSDIRRLKCDGSVVSNISQKVADNVSNCYSITEKISTSSVNRNKSRIKLAWNGKCIEDTIPLPESNHVKEELIKFASDQEAYLIQKHFPDEASNGFLQALVNKQVHNLIADILEAGSSTSDSNDYNKVKSEIMEIENTENSSDQITVTEPRYVKVVTSNGEQANLILDEKGVSYPQLQEWIKNEFTIPIRKQRIKYGFPLKVLQSFGSNNQILPLKHGDRLTVEILQKEGEDLNQENNIVQENNVSTLGSRYPGLIEDLQSSLIWSHATMNSHYFEKGGMYYEKIAKSTMLHFKMHTDLIEFQNKRFCYNPTQDRIEVCIKSLGHFRISQDLELRIDEVKHNGTAVEGFSKCPLANGQKDQKSNKNSGRTISSQNTEAKETPLLRKGPGFSILTSPKASSVEKMDIK